MCSCDDHRCVVAICLIISRRVTSSRTCTLYIKRKIRVIRVSESGPMYFHLHTATQFILRGDIHTSEDPPKSNASSDIKYDVVVFCVACNVPYVLQRTSEERSMARRLLKCKSLTGGSKIE